MIKIALQGKTQCGDRFIKDNRKQIDVVDKSFKIGLFIKGIDGIFEILGGILLLFLSPERMHSLVRSLTQHELSEDPRDVIANLLVHLSRSFSVSVQYFGVLYLAVHGITKCVFAYLLWRKKLWAYPLAAGALVLFVAYQIYRFIISPSAFLIILSAFDAVMFVLTIKEYQRMKRSDF